MGLYITGKVSKKECNFSYSNLHRIRFLALLCCNIPLKIGNKDSERLIKHFFFLPTEEYPNPDEMTEFLWSVQQAGYYFPNLMFYSDCEGSYTNRGRVFSKPGQLSGSSGGLLKELESLKRELPEKFKQGRAWEDFNKLYALVDDEVKNGKGCIYFQ